MVEVVRADESHIKDIGRLWLEFMEFSRDIDAIYTPREGAVPVFERDYLRPAMDSENGLVVAAMERKKAVGYAYAMVVEPGDLTDRPIYGCIHDMFVTAEHRRRGTGGMMYNYIIRWFEGRGIKRIELDVIHGNAYAAAFWKKQGYTEFTRKLYREI